MCAAIVANKARVRGCSRSDIMESSYNCWGCDDSLYYKKLISTYLVVIGEMGGAGRQEQLALGEVPNIAARIEGLAQPNTLVISEATSQLVQGYFQCQNLGAQTLRGVPQPLKVYRVLAARWCHKSIAYCSDTRTHTPGWSRVGSRTAPGAVGTSESGTRTGGLTER